MRALKRGTQPSVEHKDGMTWLAGDALNRQDVLEAAVGCSVIVHAVNPPGYRRWSDLVLPMLDNTLAAAVAQNATIVLPGDYLQLWPRCFSGIGGDIASAPGDPQGWHSSGIGATPARGQPSRRPSIDRPRRRLLRPQGRQQLVLTGIGEAGQPVKTVSNPGDRGVGHQWSYLPDVARTMVKLLARRDTLEDFASFHMAGHWDADGAQMTAAIQRVVDRLTGFEPRVTAFPWWLLTLASPFMATFRELREMRYLWRTPVRMDNARLIAVLGHEPHTPLDEAIEATLVGLGCLRRVGPTPVTA